MATLDINTLQFMSTAILAVLSVLMVLMWIQNKHQPAGRWWCIFSILLTIDTVLSSFPELRNMQGFVYLFNTAASFAYFFLMLGCLEFAGLRINKKYVIMLFASCILLNSIGAYLTYSDVLRRTVIISFNTVGLGISGYAIWKLNKHIYYLERNFLLILLAAHLAIHGYWLYMDFEISGTYETLFSKSVTPMYVVLIFIIIALLLLTLGKIRHQLERENSKSIALKKAMSDALRETNIANKSKSIFLTNMSHELRTPLNIILGFSEALGLEMMGPLNDKQKNIVENIHFGGKRLLSLINDLLNLSNIESGNLEKKLEKIKPNLLIKQNFETLKSVAEQYNNSFYFIEDFSDFGTDTYIQVNPEWITQILSALVDNASKYGAKKGNIWLNRFILDKNHIRITIKDEGHGIHESEIENVFKPFNRAGVDNKAIEGTGTGLAIAKGLIEAMDGTIGFESRQGTGTTFWIDLPIFNS